MGCDLVYSNRELIQMRAGKVGVCRVWYVPSDKENPRSPVCIRRSLGPNKWSSSYVFPQRVSQDLSGEGYYWIEGSDVRYLFVDSINDAWFFKNRIDFEGAISSYGRHGRSLYLESATHYSQMVLPPAKKKLNLIASRYARILSNKLFREDPVVAPAPTGTPPGEEDPIRDILDFEFNRPEPAKAANPYGLDFDAIARDAIELGMGRKP